MFVTATDKQAARATARTLREEAVAAGRRPEDIKIFVGISIIPGRTEREAQDKHREYLSYASPEAGLAHFAASTGIDFSRYDLDDTIEYGTSNAIQSATELAQKKRWTKRNLLDELALGGRYPLITGTPSAIAEELESWIDEGEIDGFNLARTVAPECFEDFVDLIVPVLQERGRYKTAYGRSSLRNRLFGGGDRLPDNHPGGRFRRPA